MSLQLDENARKWLAEHAKDLPPEELPDEYEKEECIGEWPIPELVPNIGVFSEITSQKDFNKIIGDPSNWAEIHKRPDLYEKWIVPNAIILFGKTWFDRVKWKKSIHRGISFPLFTDEDKSLASDHRLKLEDTTVGKATIAKIIAKTSYALGVYLEGKWLESSSSIKKPGGYLIDSIRNEFVRDIGTDLGYKLSSVLACPYCLSNKNINKKTPLIHNGSRQYTCPKCEELLKSLEYCKDNVNIQKKLKSVKKFSNFIGITCVCPSNDCTGYFVPLNCIDFEAYNLPDRETFKNKMQMIGSLLRELPISKSVQNFVAPPNELLDLPFECPFCYYKFTLGSAIKSKSGFKEKSGMLTGLPSIAIWEQKCTATLDQDKDEENNEFLHKDNIVGNFFDLENQILAKQKVNILIDEIIINMSKINKGPVSSLTTWYFLKSTIEWMIKYWKDAARYFFDWSIKERNMTNKEIELYHGSHKKKMTIVPRGQEVSIHQSLFHCWMNELENNMEDFTKSNSKIKSIKDFKWLCHEPDFLGGPESTFDTVVNSKMKIVNKASIRCVKQQKFIPRIARVLSIYKIENGIVDNVDFSNRIKFCEWQAIRIKDGVGLKPGDLVRVKVLLMPGHTTHAPIQRIIRLRTMLLSSIIERIKIEELENKQDMEFWQNRKNVVSAARKTTGINLYLKE